MGDMLIVVVVIRTLFINVVFVALRVAVVQLLLEQRVKQITPQPPPPANETIIVATLQGPIHSERQ